MSWSNNFPVYVSNLSPIYILSVVFSVAAFVVTIILHHRLDYFTKQSSEEDTEILQVHDQDEDALPSPYVSGESGGAVGKIKAVKQKVLLKHIHGEDLSQEQLEEEKRTEAQQLEAIWDLLKQQEDKFLTSKQQMQQQLRLYRS